MRAIVVTLLLWVAGLVVLDVNAPAIAQYMIGVAPPEHQQAVKPSDKAALNAFGLAMWRMQKDIENLQATLKDLEREAKQLNDQKEYWDKYAKPAKPGR